MIVIIDYGLGNVLAFASIYKRLNIPYRVAKSSKDLNGATKLILPGVGAFDYAMTRLEESGMREELTRMVQDQGVPVLGICVGMQMLASSSDEGELEGLGWIKGGVRSLDSITKENQLPLPHMGWNEVVPADGCPLFVGMDTPSLFYFLHSFYFTCEDEANSIAEVEYGGRFTCAVNSKNVYGVQFHPEKSHHFGVQLLKKFAEL